jgi:gas vesicle GvpC-like protein
MEKFRQERSSIAEEVAELCLDVQTFLSDVQLERQQKAEDQAIFLRQFHKNLHQENRMFLTAIQQERLSQAQKQAIFLRKFHKNLQQENRKFLTATQKERLAQAKQQKQNLRQFRQELSICVFGK